MKGIDVFVEEAPRNRGVSILRVSGYVDTTTSPDLERRLQALLREKRYHVVVDLASVEYISSAGWGIFISEIREIREHGGDLKLAGMAADVGYAGTHAGQPAEYRAEHGAGAGDVSVLDLRPIRKAGDLGVSQRAQ